MDDTLSQAQKDTLRILHGANALTFETGLTAYNSGGVRLNPNVLSRLEAKGLSLSKVRRIGRGHQMTVYWLTRAGRGAMAQLVDA